MPKIAQTKNDMKMLLFAPDNAKGAKKETGIGPTRRVPIPGSPAVRPKAPVVRRKIVFGPLLQDIQHSLSSGLRKPQALTAMATRHRIDDANASHRDAANRASGNSTGALSSRVPAGTVFTPPRMSARRDAITRPHDAASPLQDATRISHTVAGRATDATAYPPVSPAWPLLASSRFSDRRNAIIPPHDDAVPLHDAGRFRNIASGASSAAAPAYSLYPLYPSALRVARLTRHASPTHNARQTHDAAPTREAGPTRNTDPIKHASLTCDTAAGVSISTAIAALSLTAPPTCPLFPSSRVSALRDAAARLRDAGEVLGVPTDTVYALAASCRHPRSVERLYRVKERPARKPVCLCLSDIELLRDLGA